jgi:hypothetical protein
MGFITRNNQYSYRSYNKYYNAYKEVKKKKRENYKNLAYDLAKEISYELLFKPLDNSEKRNVAVRWIYNQLPSNAKKYLKEQDLIEIVNSAYHTYVKPESGKK